MPHTRETIRLRRLITPPLRLILFRPMRSARWPTASWGIRCLILMTGKCSAGKTRKWLAIFTASRACLQEHEKLRTRMFKSLNLSNQRGRRLLRPRRYAKDKEKLLFGCGFSHSFHKYLPRRFSLADFSSRISARSLLFLPFIILKPIMLILLFSVRRIPVSSI